MRTRLLHITRPRCSWVTSSRPLAAGGARGGAYMRNVDAALGGDFYGSQRSSFVPLCGQEQISVAAVRKVAPSANPPPVTSGGTFLAAAYKPNVGHTVRTSERSLPVVSSRCSTTADY
ncbi:hypothetical protein MRX96_019075 [Rhipicephalus microplus]